MNSSPQSEPSLGRALLRIVSMLMVACPLVGCAKHYYQASKLPDQFRVPPTGNVHTIDMTKLSSAGPSSTVISTGDVIEVDIATGYDSRDNHSIASRVDEQGQVTLPLIGRVSLAGLEPTEAEQVVANSAIQRGIYRKPHVTVTIKRQQSNKVTVLGAVHKPGVFELPRGSSDLINAFAAAGGLTDKAGVQIDIFRKKPLRPPTATANAPQAQLASYRAPAGQHPPQTNLASPPKPQSLRIDLREVAQGKPGDYRLSDGDVIMINPKEERVVHVMGLVRRPSQLEIPTNKDIHVLDAIAMAGGRTMQFADKVNVIRRVPNLEEPLVIEVSVMRAKGQASSNLRLAPGDVVSVEETPLTVAMDSLRSFVRIAIGGQIPLF